MGFLEALRQAVRGNTNTRSRGGAERLNLEVVRLFEEGRFPEATEAARQLLGLQRQEVGEDHPDYATALSNLALLLQRQGGLAEAEPLLRQALAIRKGVHGHSHPDCATTLNNLGELLSLRGDFEGAEVLLRQALAIRKESLGEGHPDYAISLSSLALVLNKRGDSLGAESLLRQALDVRRDMLGELDPDYATGLSNLALLLLGRGDLAQAETLLRQALEIRRAALGENHPDSIATSNTLSRLLRRRSEATRLDATIPPTQPTEPGEASPPDTGTSRDRVPIDAGPSSADGTGGDLRPNRGLEEIAEDAARLAEIFKESGDRLAEAGRRMSADGVFPGPDLFRTLAVCHLHLSSLRVEVRGLSESLGVPCPPPEKVDGLPKIRSLIEAVARISAQEARSQALDILKKVLCLRIIDQEEADLPALQECQANARELYQIISDSPAFEPPPVADQLTAGEHPFACLLALVDLPTSLGHDWRIALQRTVAWAYGPSLAESAAQARLFLAHDIVTLQPAGPTPSDLGGGTPGDRVVLDG